MFTSRWAWPAHWPIRFWASGETTFTKIGDYLPWMPMSCRAEFDAGEIRNRTNKQTHKQTVNNISTPCLSACVDNNWSQMKERRFAVRENKQDYWYYYYEQPQQQPVPQCKGCYGYGYY